MAPWPLRLFLLLAVLNGTQAYRLKFAGSFTPSSILARQSRTPGSAMLINEADVSYHTDIVVGNQTFEVLIDTGSSDLWVAGSVKGSTNTGKNATIKYAAHSVSGQIKRANVQFAGQTVVKQAFLEILPNEKNIEGHGILGLGPGLGSFMTKELPLGASETLLNRLFSQGINHSDYFTLLLGRHNDPTNFFQGTITVGEILPEYTAIRDEPKLPVTLLKESDYMNQHLQVLLDADGIMGPDGHSIPITTLVEQTENEKQATVVFDSGFTFTQLPREIVDGIYGQFSQSQYRDVPGIGGVYVLPCVQEVNLTLKFAGISYHVHPLDMTMDPIFLNSSALETSDGQNACIGTFQPFTFARRRDPTYDIVLGMSFLRNVYSFFDYERLTQSPTDFNSPYVQLLSITDPVQAHKDFVTIRLGGVDTTGDRKPGAMSTGKRKTVYYVAGGIGAILVVAAVVVFFAVRSRRRR